MSNVRIIPILDIAAKYPEFQRVFGQEAYDLLNASNGFQSEEEYTFTFRMSLDLLTEEGLMEKAYITGRLRTLGTPAAEELIKLLDDNDWNVSFFADFF